MATTMKLIAKNTLGSDAASVTFSDIPSTYTDLVLLYSARSARTGTGADNVNIRFNGSSATNYSIRYLEGNVTSASSASASSQAQMLVGYSSSSDTTANTFATGEIYIPNYAGSTNKSVSSTFVTENNGASTGNAYIGAVAGLWSQTSAITSIDVLSQVANFKSGSSFYLYGITKA